MSDFINYYVQCQIKGAEQLVAGVSSMELELFKITKGDLVIPQRSAYDAEEFGA